MAITELRISGVRGVVHDTEPNNGGALKLTFKLYMFAVLRSCAGGVFSN